MSFKEFLSELGLLINDRAVISCIYPKIVALDVVNAMTTLNYSYPGIISTSGRKVKKHLIEHQHPSLVFITEYLEDGSGLELIQSLQGSDLDCRCILILTCNHNLNPDLIENPYISGITLDHNIGGPTCVLTSALRAVNQNQHFVDPELIESQHKSGGSSFHLSERECQVMKLVANGLSNKEIGQKLFIAPTTVRDHMQSVMRKLNVKSRTGAAVACLRQGLLDPE